MYDPYERKRRAARLSRQGKLARIATAGLPIDGDPTETRKPVEAVGGLVDAVMEGRDFVLPSDVDRVVTAVSAGCISLTSLARAEGHTFNSEMRHITESVSDPDRKEQYQCSE